MTELEELVLYLVQKLVEQKDKIEIVVLEADDKYEIELKVAKEDMPKIIGKQGKIINAIRGIISLYSIKNNSRVFLELKEKED